MRENTSSWFVVQTHANQEQRALAHLERQGFEAYLPCYLRRRRHARRTQAVPRPLYPRYLFVSLDLVRDRWRVVNSTFGVLRLVCQGDRPAAIDSAVIAGLKARENEDGLVRLEPASRLARGDMVRVVDGAFAQCLGLFEAIAAKDRVAILLDVLGRKVRLVVDGEAIEPAG